MNALNDSVSSPEIYFTGIKIIIFLDLDTQCKSLTEQVGVLTTARDAALAENATLSANVAQLEVNSFIFDVY